MAIIQLVLWFGEAGEEDAAFWFSMQMGILIGLVTTYPLK